MFGLGADMSRPDVFALQNSKLNPFLFADIGTELNGSTLTILSALSRLGKDPWAEAARWAQEPKADAIDSLAASIIEMPLSPQAIHDAHSTASRLVSLLPEQFGGPLGSPCARPAPVVLPKWGLMMLVSFWLFLILNAGLALSHRPDPAVTTPVVQPTSQPQ
jgi:hypothetical protein